MCSLLRHSSAPDHHCRSTCDICWLFLKLFTCAFTIMVFGWISKLKWKKPSERRKHCALAVVRRSQKFSPRRRPLPGGTGRPKFNQLEMVTTFTHKPSLVRIDAAVSSYRGNRPTNTQTNKETHRQDRLQYTAPLNLALSKGKGKGPYTWYSASS